MEDVPKLSVTPHSSQSENTAVTAPASDTALPTITSSAFTRCSKS